jgi:hypothetical protein
LFVLAIPIVDGLGGVIAALDGKLEVGSIARVEKLTFKCFPETNH